MKKLNLFRYVEYRKYLNDRFVLEKKENPRFSHRYLSKEMGLTSPNYVLLIMQGKRNVTPVMCHKISGAFGFTTKESEYFETLVLFNQAKTPGEKDRYFTRMALMRKNMKIEKIEERQYDYFTQWYNLVVRELVTLPGFKGDFAALAQRIVPRISESQARKSVDLLLALGLIKKKAGRFVPSAPVIGTENEVQSLAVANYHKTMLGLAREAIERLPRQRRNITAAVLHVSRSKYKMLTQEIADFRERLLALAETDPEPDQVYQLNVQLFPVTEA